MEIKNRAVTPLLRYGIVEYSYFTITKLIFVSLHKCLVICVYAQIKHLAELFRLNLFLKRSHRMTIVNSPEATKTRN